MKYLTIDVFDSEQNFSDRECPAFKAVTVFCTLSIDFVETVVSIVSGILRYTPATI